MEILPRVNYITMHSHNIMNGPSTKPGKPSNPVPGPAIPMSHVIALGAVFPYA